MIALRNALIEIHEKRTERYYRYFLYKWDVLDAFYAVRRCIGEGDRGDYYKELIDYIKNNHAGRAALPDMKNEYR